MNYFPETTIARAENFGGLHSARAVDGWGPVERHDILYVTSTVLKRPACFCDKKNFGELFPLDVVTCH